MANRTEYRLFKRYGKQNDLAPTLLTLCWIINVQLRGRPAGDEDARHHRIWNILDRTSFSPLVTDLLQPEQFCIIGSKVYIADYGIELIEPILAANQ